MIISLLLRRSVERRVDDFLRGNIYPPNNTLDDAVGVEDTVSASVDSDDQGFEKTHDSYRSRRKAKAFKVKQTVEAFRVSKEQTLERVEGLSRRVLVGFMEYLNMSRMELLQWAQDTWKPLVDYYPCIFSLPKGWFAFVFLWKEHAERVLNSFWLINEGSLVSLEMVDAL